jgi:hypothetical protein
MVPPPMCFRENSKILCLVNNEDVYIPIQYIRKGMLVKTLSKGYIPVEMIGRSTIDIPVEDNKDGLYVCPIKNYPELFEDLIITAHHSILVDRLTDEQRAKTIECMGNVYITEGKSRLIACLDERAEPYTKVGTHKIWHFALENDNYFNNYGVYANGLLVETTSKRMIKEVSGLEIVK